MAEDSSLALPCTDCGATFYRKSPLGAPPRRCPPCRKVSRRAISAATKRRRRDGVPRPTTFTCEGCRVEFPRPDMQGQLPKRCPPCWDDHEKRRSRLKCASQSAVLAAKFLEVGRWGECLDCHEAFRMRNRSGTATQRCDNCTAVRRRKRATQAARHRRKPAPPRPDFTCLDCAGTFPQSRFGRRRLRCKECAYKAVLAGSRRTHAANRLRARSYRARRRVRKFGVGYERFGASEVFERDRWKCGICRRAIDRTLRYPHPMSVSLDHKVPLCKGGPHSRSNTQAAHLRCNLRKRESAAPLGEQIPLPI